MEREQKLSMKVQAWRTCSKWDRVSNMKQLLIERMGVVEVTCNIHIIYYLLVFLEVFGEKNTQSNRNNIKNNYFKSLSKHNYIYLSNKLFNLSFSTILIDYLVSVIYVMRIIILILIIFFFTIIIIYRFRFWIWICSFLLWILFVFH